MKRMSRTLTAAALSGALALGGTAVATAQIPAPATIEVDGTTYNKQEDGSYTSATNGDKLDSDKLNEALAALQSEEAEAGPSTPIKLAPDYDASAPASDSEVAGPSEVDYPIADGDASSSKEAAPSSSKEAAPSSSEEQEPSSSEFDTKKLAWLALPAALVIGGVTWYLAKDGKTYVKSEAAAQNAEPSAEEKAASEQMLEANKDEVIAQGGKVAESTAEKTQVESRGMSAETGSNTVARGVAALAIAAMIAAGAFAARRKFFI